MIKRRKENIFRFFKQIYEFKPNALWVLYSSIFLYETKNKTKLRKKRPSLPATNNLIWRLIQNIHVNAKIKSFTSSKTLMVGCFSAALIRAWKQATNPTLRFQKKITYSPLFLLKNMYLLLLLLLCFFLSLSPFFVLLQKQKFKWILRAMHD